MAAWATTLRQDFSAFSMAFLKYGANSSDTLASPDSNASEMRLRNFARMMQPPRQMRATAARSMSQPYSLAAVVISLKPCA